MYFQVLDDKTDCIGIYANEKLYYDEFPKHASRTWKYSSILRDRNDIEYADIRCNGASLVDVCPEDLKGRLDKILARLRAFLVSFKEAKISLYDNCFYDLVPRRFLLEYFDVKNQITKHVIEEYQKPKNYSFLLNLTKVVEDIKYRKLNIDMQNFPVDHTSVQGRNIYKKIKKIDPYISYDIFGSKTGRLTTRKNSFPILTLDKSYRSVLKPNNDYFVELDFNSAEIRTFLALQELSQPEEDIHAWIGENVFNGQLNREETKKKFFAWFYNPEAKNDKLEKIFDKQKVLDNYWNGYSVNTPYNREIEAGKKHALNYLVQSATSDLFLRRMNSVWNFLQDRMTSVAFCIHDSLVLDFSADERALFSDVINIFSSTEFGEFKTNVRAGKDFGNMREIRWKQ